MRTLSFAVSCLIYSSLIQAQTSSVPVAYEYAFTNPQAGTVVEMGEDFTITWAPAVSVNNATYWLVYGPDGLNQVYDTPLTTPLPIPNLELYVWAVPTSLTAGVYTIAMSIAQVDFPPYVPTIATYTYSFSSPVFTITHKVSVPTQSSSTPVIVTDTSNPTTASGNTDTTSNSLPTPETTTLYPTNNPTGGDSSTEPTETLTTTVASTPSAPGQASGTGSSSLSATNTSSPSPSSGLSVDGRTSLIEGLAIGIPSLVLAAISLWYLWRADGRELLTERLARITHWT